MTKSVSAAPVTEYRGVNLVFLLLAITTIVMTVPKGGGSRQAGAMGMPEAIPFGSQKAADDFAAREGGVVVKLADIPDKYLGPANASPTDHSDMQM